MTVSDQVTEVGVKYLAEVGAEKVPAGYKQTEVGVIPEDWDIKTYGDVFVFLSISTNSRADLSAIGDYGYIHYGDIHTEWSIRLDLSVIALPKIAQHLVSSELVENGDLLMADASEDYEGTDKRVEVFNLNKQKVVAGLHTFLLRDISKVLADGYRGYLHVCPQSKNLLIV